MRTRVRPPILHDLINSGMGSFLSFPGRLGGQRISCTELGITRMQARRPVPIDYQRQGQKEHSMRILWGQPPEIGFQA